MVGAMRVILEIGKKRRVVAGRHGLAGPRSLGDLGRGRAREAVVLPPALRRRRRARRPGGDAREQRRRWSWSSGSPDRARPTTGASPTCLGDRARRPVAAGPRAPARPRCRPAGPTSTTSRDASQPSSGSGRAAAGGPATSSSAMCTSTSPSSSRARSRSARHVRSCSRRRAVALHREADLDAIRAYNAEGKPARTWPLQFLIRRIAHHVMDHAWEMEDRDLGS